MFSGALLQALQQGAPKIDTPLSMEQIGAQVKEIIRENYPDDAVRPEVLSPDQRAEDIALVPIFPNAATLPRQIKHQLEEAISRLAETRSALEGFSARLEAIDRSTKTRLDALENDVQSLIPLRSRIDELQIRPADDDHRLSEIERIRENERMVLKSAPPHVVAEVYQYRRARLAGKIWVLTSFVIVLPSMWCLRKPYSFASSAESMGGFWFRKSS